MRVSHLTLYLGPRYERSYAIDDHDVEGVRAHEGIGYLEGLFAVIWLGEVEVLEVNAYSLGVGRVEGVLGVDEGCEPTCPLGLGYYVQGEGSLAARFGAEDLDDTSPWNSADAKCQVEGKGSRRYRGDLLGLLVTHAHDRAFPELPLYLRDGCVNGFGPIQCILQKAVLRQPM